MSSIVAGISETVKGVANTIAATITTIINAVLSVFAMVADVAKHAVSFVLANIIPIGVVVALLVGFSAYQQRQGKAIGGSTTRAKIQGKKRA